MQRGRWTNDSGSDRKIHCKRSAGSLRVMLLPQVAAGEEYVCALMELDRQSCLNPAEQNFAELLILLIEAYVEKPHSGRFVSTVWTTSGMVVVQRSFAKKLILPPGFESFYRGQIPGATNSNKLNRIMHQSVVDAVAPGDFCLPRRCAPGIGNGNSHTDHASCRLGDFGGDFRFQIRSGSDRHFDVL